MIFCLTSDFAHCHLMPYLLIHFFPTSPSRKFLYCHIYLSVCPVKLLPPTAIFCLTCFNELQFHILLFPHPCPSFNLLNPPNPLQLLPVQPMEIFVDDETKLTLHGLQQYYVKLKDNEKNRKLFDLLDVLEFNQVLCSISARWERNPPRKVFIMSLLCSLLMGIQHRV